MKSKIFAAAALILTASLLGACAQNESTVPTSAAEKPLQSARSTDAPSTTEYTTGVFATELSTLTEPVTEQLTTQTETTTVPPTTKVNTTKAPSSTKAQTTKAETTVPATTDNVDLATTSSGRVYKDDQIEVVGLRYGVVRHKYKTVFYQMIDGKRVDVGYEYTGEFINKRNYSATYDELLPEAKKNSEKYRDYIEENLRIINSYRAKKGLAPLKLNEKMTVMACARAEEIAWSGKRSHRRPDGSRCFTIFKEAGFEKGTAGENLGYVFDNPEDVCQAWKDSPTHYENLMNPDFTEIGIGVAADPDERGKLCWVNHFLTET